MGPGRLPLGPGQEGRPPWSPTERQIAVIAGVVLVVLVVLVKVHRITYDEVLFFAALVPSIILHEVSHGVVALALGDDTAKRAGRLTLNPLAHIDLLGSLILPAIMIATAGVAFGWAKPVPVAVNRLRSPRNHVVLVGLAGPATNALLAAVFGAVFVFVTPAVTKELFMHTGSVSAFSVVSQFCLMGGFANVLLGVFNLIPIPPLDGSAVIERLLPGHLLAGYYRIRMLMLVPLIVVVLVFPGVIDSVVNPIFSFWGRLVGL